MLQLTDYKIVTEVLNKKKMIPVLSRKTQNIFLDCCLKLTKVLRGEWCTLDICVPRTYANSSFTCLDH